MRMTGCCVPGTAPDAAAVLPEDVSRIWLRREVRFAEGAEVGGEDVAGGTNAGAEEPRLVRGEGVKAGIMAELTGVKGSDGNAGCVSVCVMKEPRGLEAPTSGVGCGACCKPDASKDAEGLAIAKDAPKTSVELGLESRGAGCAAAPKSNRDAVDEDGKSPAVTALGGRTGVLGCVGVEAEICIGDSGDAADDGEKDAGAAAAAAAEAIFSRGGGVMEQELLSLWMGF